MGYAVKVAEEGFHEVTEVLKATKLLTRSDIVLDGESARAEAAKIVQRGGVIGTVPILSMGWALTS